MKLKKKGGRPARASETGRPRIPLPRIVAIEKAAVCASAPRDGDGMTVVSAAYATAASAALLCLC